MNRLCKSVLRTGWLVGCASALASGCGRARDKGAGGPDGRSGQITRSAGALGSIQNLVALWKGDGDARDAVGTLHGDLIPTVGFVSGHAGQAFRLSGGRVVVSDAGFPDLPRFTVDFWLKPDTIIGPGLPTAQIVWTKGPFSNWIGFQNGSGKLEVRLPGGSSIFSTTEHWSADVWHHVTLTYDGETYVLYIGGMQEAAERNPTSLMVNNNEMIIGYPTAAYSFAGAVDDVAIYDRDLTGVCGAPVSGGACDDGNGCTVGDTCDSAGACLAGPATGCVAPVVFHATIRQQSEIQLEWTLTDLNHDGVRVERSADGGATWSVVPGCDLPQEARMCIDQMVWLDRPHRYRVFTHGGQLRSPAAELEIQPPASFCEGQPAGAPCDDGNGCTVNEACDGGGQCVSGGLLGCDTGIVCLSSTCSPSLGCQHTDVCQGPAPLLAPVTVSAVDRLGRPVADVTIQPYLGTTAAGAPLVTGPSGIVNFLITPGSYRFQASVDARQFWSETECNTAACAHVLLEVADPLCGVAESCSALIRTGPVLHVLASAGLGDDVYYGQRSTADPTDWPAPLGSILPQTGAPWRGAFSSQVIADVAIHNMGNELYAMVVVKSEACEDRLPPAPPDCSKLTTRYSLWQAVRGAAGWGPFERLHPFGVGVDLTSIDLTGFNASLLLCGTTPDGSVVVAERRWNNTAWIEPVNLYELTGDPGPASDVACRGVYGDGFGHAVAVVVNGRALVTFLTKESSSSGRRWAAYKEVKTGGRDQWATGFKDLTADFALPAIAAKVEIAEDYRNERMDTHVVVAAANDPRKWYFHTKFPTDTSWARDFAPSSNTDFSPSMALRTVGPDVELIQLGQNRHMWASRRNVAQGTWAPLTETGGGQLALAEVAFVEPLDIPLPPAPGTMSEEDCGIRLTWDDADDFEQGYHVYDFYDFLREGPALQGGRGTVLIPRQELEPGRAYYLSLTSFGADGNSFYIPFRVADGGRFPGSNQFHTVARATVPKVKFLNTGHAEVSWDWLPSRRGPASILGTSKVLVLANRMSGNTVTEVFNSPDLDRDQTSFRFPYNGINGVELTSHEYEFVVISRAGNCVQASEVKHWYPEERYGEKPRPPLPDAPPPGCCGNSTPQWFED